MKISYIASALLLSSTLTFAFNLENITKTVVDTVNKTTQTPTEASTTSSLSNSTVSSGLKEALSQGVKLAVETLGKENGYLNNSAVKIPLPENLQKVEGMIRKAGGGEYADSLIKSMNDAATEAAPQTANIFLEAIEKMNMDDAKNILSGSSNAATNYFKTNTHEQLSALIMPIVQKSMSNNQVASYYKSFNSFYQSQGKGLIESTGVMDYAKSLGVDSYLPTASEENLDEYITSKAISGLFTMIEQEEAAIRKDPVKQTTSLLKQVFGN